MSKSPHVGLFPHDDEQDNGILDALDRPPFLIVDGYFASISDDAETGAITGLVVNTITDELRFQAPTRHEAPQALSAALELYRTECSKRGQLPEIRFLSTAEIAQLLGVMGEEFAASSYEPVEVRGNYTTLSDTMQAVGPRNFIEIIWYNEILDAMHYDIGYRLRVLE